MCLSSIHSPSKECFSRKGLDRFLELGGPKIQIGVVACGRLARAFHAELYPRNFSSSISVSCSLSTTTHNPQQIFTIQQLCCAQPGLLTCLRSLAHLCVASYWQCLINLDLLVSSLVSPSVSAPDDLFYPTFTWRSPEPMNNMHHHLKHHHSVKHIAIYRMTVD